MTAVSGGATVKHRTAPRRRKSLAATVTQLEARCQELERARNGLLDIVNAACIDRDGALVIREASWQAARRLPLEWLLRPGAVVIRPIGGAHAANDALRNASVTLSDGQGAPDHAVAVSVHPPGRYGLPTIQKENAPD